MSAFKSLKLLFLAAVIIQSAAATGADWKSLFDSGFQAMENGDYQNARTLFEQSISVNDENQEVWQEYSACLRKLKDPQTALKAGWRALECGQESSVLWNNIGNILLDCHAWNEALDAYKKSYTLTDDRKGAIQSILDLGYEMMLFRDFEGARKIFEYAYSLDDESGLALLDLGILSALTGDSERGRIRITKAIIFLKDESNEPGLAYARGALDEIKRTKTLSVPFPLGRSYQTVPSLFLIQPVKDKALKLKISPTITRNFPVSADKIMSVTTPSDWYEKTEINLREMQLSITFSSSKQETPFSFSINPVITDESYDLSIPALTSMLTINGEKLIPQSTEGKLSIQDFSKNTVTVLSFALTDKNYSETSPPDEYQYITQGVAVQDRVMHSFTLLSQSVKKDVIRPIFTAIQSITYK